MNKALTIFGVILIGSIFTIGSEWKFLIRPNLMAMLFFSFMSIQLDRTMIRKAHFGIIICNILLPLIFYFSLQSFNPTLATSAFIISLIPTGVAAPILAQIMKRNIGIVTFSVILTTPIMALATPVLLLCILDSGAQFSMQELIVPIITLIGVPLLLSQLIRWFAPLKIMGALSKLGVITFPLFLLNLFIACGDASEFIQQNTAYSYTLLLGILGIAAMVAIIQFQLGRRLGNAKTNVEFSLSLGRKNTMLGIWIALTYFEPIIVLGPVFYILVQNIYNSFEIWYLERGR